MRSCGSTPRRPPRRWTTPSASWRDPKALIPSPATAPCTALLAPLPHRGWPESRADAVHAADGACPIAGLGRSRQRSMSRRILAACRHRHRARSSRQARALVPLREPPSGGHRAHGAHERRVGARPTQDPVPRRRHAPRDRAAGFSGAVGGAGIPASNCG